MEYISTTALAQQKGITVNEMFNKLREAGLIDRQNDKWILTKQGRTAGGDTRSNPKFGEFIVWPENLSLENNQPAEKFSYLNSTALGKHFDISPQRVNLVLSELGWIKKTIAGWELTKIGKLRGGKQLEHETSGGTYTIWPKHVLDNIALVQACREIIPVAPATAVDTATEQVIAPKQTDNFRERFPATLRTKDGHWVRSRAEVLIDNALYDYKLAHAYEKKLPVEEEIYTDFYLPEQSVYIEYWGLEDDPKYAERKQRKLEIYKKYECKLIELTDADINNLDDHLPKKLLKFGIKVY